jgi:hypothetical protein
MNLMGFDLSKLVHEIVHPFAGTMQEVVTELKETNRKLDKMNALLEQLVEQHEARND